MIGFLPEYILTCFLRELVAVQEKLYCVSVTFVSFTFFMVGLCNSRYLLVKLNDNGRVQSRIERVNEEKGSCVYSFLSLINRF